MGSDDIEGRLIFAGTEVFTLIGALAEENDDEGVTGVDISGEILEKPLEKPSARGSLLFGDVTWLGIFVAGGTNAKKRSGEPRIEGSEMHGRLFRPRAVPG